MPPAAVLHQAQLIVDRAGEAAAAMAEQLAVGELARGRRAVVWQEHRRASQRPDVDGSRDQLFADAALAGDQHRELVALQPLNVLDDAHHGGAGAEEPGHQGLEGLLVDDFRRGRRTLACRAQVEPLGGNRGDHPEAPAKPVEKRPLVKIPRRAAVRRCRGRSAPIRPIPFRAIGRPPSTQSCGRARYRRRSRQSGGRRLRPGRRRRRRSRRGACRARRRRFHDRAVPGTPRRRPGA